MLKKTKYLILMLLFILLFLNVAYSHELTESDFSVTFNDESDVSATYNEEYNYMSDIDDIKEVDKVSDDNKVTKEMDEESDNDDGCCSTILQVCNGNSRGINGNRSVVLRYI